MLAILIIAFFVIVLDFTGFGLDESHKRLLYVEDDASDNDIKETKEPVKPNKEQNTSLEVDEDYEKEASKLLNEIYTEGKK